jgi:hypothetical protein
MARTCTVCRHRVSGAQGRDRGLLDPVPELLDTLGIPHHLVVLRIVKHDRGWSVSAMLLPTNLRLRRLREDAAGVLDAPIVRVAYRHTMSLCDHFRPKDAPSSGPKSALISSLLSSSVRISMTFSTLELAALPTIIMKTARA